MTIQKNILKRMGDMTQSQRLMAEYVLDHSELVAFMTAKQLADKLGQSDASVIRFARTLGYNGYTEMRKNLRQSLLGRVGAGGLHKQSVDTAEHKLLDAVLETESNIIAGTARLNDVKLMAEVADKIIQAKEVSVSGHSTSYPLASYLAMHLNQCLGTAKVFNIGNGDLAERFRNVDSGHVFIGIGYIRYLPYTIEIMRLARERGAHVIAITDKQSSPLAQLAHQSLFVVREESSPIWWSQTGTMLIANWLTSLIMIRDSARVEQQLQRADEELRRIGLWDWNDNR